MGHTPLGVCSEPGESPVGRAGRGGGSGQGHAELPSKAEPGFTSLGGLGLGKLLHCSVPQLAQLLDGRDHTFP